MSLLIESSRAIFHLRILAGKAALSARSGLRSFPLPNKNGETKRRSNGHSVEMMFGDGECLIQSSD
jgi:hypothetical protein